MPTPGRLHTFNSYNNATPYEPMEAFFLLNHHSMVCVCTSILLYAVMRRAETFCGTQKFQITVAHMYVLRSGSDGISMFQDIES